MNTRFNRQGGWVVSFAVVGVILLVALLGSIYFLRQQSSSDHQIAKDDSSKTSEKSKTNESDNTSSDSDKTDKNNSTEGQTQREPSTNTSDDQSNPTTSQRSTGDENGSDLPETGPGDVAVHIVAVSLLSFALTSYIRSRQLV